MKENIQIEQPIIDDLWKNFKAFRYIEMPTNKNSFKKEHDSTERKILHFIKNLLGIKNEVPSWVVEKSENLWGQKISDGSIYGQTITFGFGRPEKLIKNTGDFICFENENKMIAVLLDKRFDLPQKRGWVVAAWEKESKRELTVNVSIKKWTNEQNLEILTF